ncbi:MAG TPA: glutamyl-tRNA reductase [Acidobacteriota bacterium]|nr:glutamyl-tRNA reductase [Acidobacteriota bacterium]
MSEINNLVLVGLNHRTATLDIRQSAYFSAEQLPVFLKRLSSVPEILECMLIPTCNRVEILAAVEHRDDGINVIESFLTDYSAISPLLLHPKLYRFSGEQTVRHIFRLASSLDSMIVGEPQILGQLKSFYSEAVKAGTAGFHLNSLVQTAFRVAKKVRSQTSIGENPVSAGSAAAELARNIFADLREKKILIVGAGKMGKAALRHLHEAGVEGISVVNRNVDAAIDLAGRFDGIAAPLSELRACISHADIVIISTGASEILIDTPMAEAIMRERKNAPLVFIDISALPNVDPGVGKLPDVFYYNIDDLGSVIETNLNKRAKAAMEAGKIVDDEVRNFTRRIRFSKSVPLISRLQQQMEDICRSELHRCLNRMESPSPKDIFELELTATRIAAKITHPLLRRLRERGELNEEALCADLIKDFLAEK